MSLKPIDRNNAALVSEAIHEEASGWLIRPGGIIMVIAGVVLFVLTMAWGPESSLGSLPKPLVKAWLFLVVLLFPVGAGLHFENRNRIILTADELRVGKEVFDTS